MPHRVVIIGGGFGGLEAAQALRRADVEVTLIDRRNFHLFQPLLYQVATGGLSPANIAAPLRRILKRQRNAQVYLGEVVEIDAQRRRIICHENELPYDTLIVATGSRHHYFGHSDWERIAPGLKTIEDATEIRRRILLAFEEAERTADPEELGRLLTFVIVGGGPTGVELAGTLGEMAAYTLRHEFRHIETAAANIVLIEGEDRVLPTYAPELSQKAIDGLARLGVSTRTGTMVTDMQPDAVTFHTAAEDRNETIPTYNVFWAAGVKASSLGEVLQRATGAPLDRGGRVIVEPDCSVPGHPEIFVVGDLAHFGHGTERPLPGVAPVAIQQGRYVAGVVRNRLAGRQSPAFRYKDRGSLATIGRALAVADVFGMKFNGFPAWLTWLVVHLMQLVGFENRILVSIQWGWNWLTRGRAARLITGEATPAHPCPTETLLPAHHAKK